jgi:molecular chaperone HtpG
LDITLETLAEKEAARASDLDAFSGISVLHIKKQVGELLSHIGKYQLFDEYTKHDITHVSSMLRICDWLVPESATKQMTTADWLMIVLSVYFHDLGMLVTLDEYRDRDRSSFPEFKEERLLTPDNLGRDYAGKLARLEQNELDRFLYQEFVRAHHADRIRAWIDRPTSRILGVSQPIADAVQQLLSPLPPAFRADLGLVCESHHLNDLENIQKYPVRQPYGNSKEEIANVQYAAIILRTTDLLQVTRERTPSIAYRVLNPSDPTSQQEWAKQMAVTAVVSQPAVTEDGVVDTDAPRDTIEYHAHFTSEAGFFGLTHYLAYAEQQIQLSNTWAEESRTKHGVPSYTFPWRYIDQSKIRTEGFLRKQFQFEIDQAKILDLLTGHTLYNDTNVVLRELTQNAIDAVRLQHSDSTGAGPSAEKGHVIITWDSNERTMEFLDDGTGMTQNIIEQNFLKVGASRYQEDSFREQYPNFSPISRFGIGVLSAFMVADSVEVVTVHPDDEKARRISLRSVHGKYLIRLP